MLEFMNMESFSGDRSLKIISFTKGTEYFFFLSYGTRWYDVYINYQNSIWYILYFLDLFMIPWSRETGFADRPVLAFKGYPNLEILGEA